MNENTVNLQTRTAQKLRFAKVMLEELERLPGTGGDFDCAHQEAFLFHLRGALDAFLAEINVYYDCKLDPDDITQGNLRERIRKARGENAPELKELYELEKEGGWLKHIKVTRDHSTHLGGLPLTHKRSSEGSSTLLNNPEKTAEVIEEEDIPSVFRRWHEQMGELVTRLRASAVAQAPPGTI
jgi:hypothetical protein